MAEQSWGYDAPPLGFNHMQKSEPAVPPATHTDAKPASFSAQRPEHLTLTSTTTSGFSGPSKAVSEAVRQIKSAVAGKASAASAAPNAGEAAYGAEPQRDQIQSQDPSYAQPETVDRPAAGFVSATKLPSFGTIVNFSGGVLSLILLVALGGWGYKLAMRDVSGIPVVRALEGPMRVQPEDPGGQIADHQGLAVNAVQAEGQAEAPADQLTLAPLPENIEDFVEPDAWSGSDTAQLDDNAQSGLASLAEPARPIDLPDDPVAAALALAEQVSSGSQRLTSKTISVTPPPGAAVDPSGNDTSYAALLDIIPASIPGVRRSLVPTARPLDLDTTPKAGSASESSFFDVDSASIPTGTRLVQLGAFDSPAVARAEWDRLFIKFGDYMEGKTRVVQQAQSSGKTFYRLRVMGFSGLADAKRFCSVFKAQNAACIPLVTR